MFWFPVARLPLRHTGQNSPVCPNATGNDVITMIKDNRAVVIVIQFVVVVVVILVVLHIVGNIVLFV
jgi:hypothetical protein